jgi:hypothetical protein
LPVVSSSPRIHPVFSLQSSCGLHRLTVPHRDLLISPDHALLVDNVLINAGVLVNGISIIRETVVPRT